MRARQRVRGSVPVIAALLLATAFATPAGATTKRCTARVITVRGTYHLITSTISNLRPEGALVRYDENASTNWAGALQGHSASVGGGTADPVTGNFDNHLHEVFTGIVHGLGVGHLEWDEDSTGTVGGPTLASLTVDVRGHLSRGDVVGRLTFVTTDPGRQDATGASDVLGTYEGHLTVRGPGRSH